MTWVWVQPRDQNELLRRLADARDLDVAERERENLCACAYTEIKRLQQETLDLHAAGCAESERADAAETEATRDRLLMDLQLQDARHHVTVLTEELLCIRRSER